MRIEWKKECEILIFETEDDCEGIVEERKAGEVEDVDIFGYASSYSGKKFPQIQFGDGSITGAIDEDWFRVLS